MRKITSRHNPLVAQYRAAARGRSAGVILLDGAHLLRDALHAGVEIQHVAVAADALGHSEVGPLVTTAAAKGIHIDSATSAVMDAISPVRSASQVVALAARPRTDGQHLYDRPNPFVIIAAGVQDPGNIGAIVRVAEAGGASAVVTDVTSADPFGWKALRGGMGGSLRLPIAIVERIGAAVDEARRAGCRIVASAPRDGRSIFETDLTGPVAVLIGSEGAGLSAAVLDSADARISIPMQSPVESLNAATTAAIVVYEARRQRTETALRGSAS